MKCKVCGYEFDSNRAYCPMCGSKVPEAQKRIADEEMSWNTYDFPKPKVPEDIEMHWPSMKAGSSVSVMKKDATEGFIRSERPAEPKSDPPADPVWPSSEPKKQPAAEPQAAPIQQEAPAQSAPQPSAAPAAPQAQTAPQQPFSQGAWQMPQMQPEPTWTPYNVQTQPQQPVQAPVIPPMYVPQYTPPQMAWTLPSQPSAQTGPVYVAQPAQQVYIPPQPVYPQPYPAYPQQTQPIPPMQQTQPVPPMQQTQPVPPVQQTQQVPVWQPAEPVAQPAAPQTVPVQPQTPVQSAPVQPQPPLQTAPQSAPKAAPEEAPAAPVQPRSRFLDEDEPDRVLKENIVATSNSLEIPEEAYKQPEPAYEKPREKSAPQISAAEPETDLFDSRIEPDEDGRIPERFFTFNKKNEEFQQLLNREYERLRSIHGDDAPSIPRTSAPFGEPRPVTPAQAFFQDDTLEPSDLSEFEKMILESTVDAGGEKTIAINRERIKGASGLKAEDLIEPLVPGLTDTIPRGASKENLAQIAERKAQAAEAAAAPKQEEPEDPRSDHRKRMDAMRVARQRYFETLLSITGERRAATDADILAERESAEKEAAAIAAAAKEDAEAEAKRRAEAEEAARLAEIERAAKEREDAIARAQAEMNAALEKRRTAELEVQQGEQEAGEEPAEAASAEVQTDENQPKAAETQAPERALDPSQLLTEEEKEAEEKKNAEDRTAALTEVLDKADEQNRIREEREKSHWFLKCLLALVIVIALAEGGTVALRHFMPGSPAQVITTGIEQNVVDFLKSTAGRVKGVFVKDEEPQTEDPQQSEGEASETETPHFVFSEAVAAVNKNIESVVENLGIGYDSQRSYGIQGLASSVLAEEGEKEDVCKVLIAYNSSWIDYVNGVDQACLDYLKADGTAYRSAVNFDRIGQITERFVQLEIGEIRKSGDSYFVFDRETIEVTQGEQAANSVSSMVYELVPVGGELKIKEYYTLN